MLDAIVHHQVEADLERLERAERVRPPAPTLHDSAVLSARDLSISFGGVRALEGVSFDVARSQIYAIIGPNGAGKSTLLNLVSGVYRASSGVLRVNGRDVTSSSTIARAELRIGRTFQHPSLFKGLSVVENILAGRHARTGAGLFSCAVYFGRARNEERRERERAHWILEFLGLAELEDARVDTLPYGLQKRIELGRTLALEPTILLLDEPMAGMTPHEKKEMVEVIRKLNETRGITVVLIEHDMGVVMRLSQRILVLDHGVKIAEGSPAQVAADPTVIDAYLGQS